MRADVKGAKELIKKLADLRQFATLDRISYRATQRTANTLKELALNNARASTHEQSGALLRGFARKKTRIGTKRGYSVGVRASAKRGKAGGDDPFYWWFLEFGTAHMKNSNGYGFFRRAWAQYQGAAKDSIMEAAAQQVFASAKRALKKIGNGKSMSARR